MPYLDPLVNKIIEMTLSDIIDIQEVALSALSATASASDIHFSPYSENIIELCRNFFNLSKKFPDEHWKIWQTASANIIPKDVQREMTRALVVKGRALEVVGIICQSLGGKNINSSIINEFMQYAKEAYELNLGSLREHAYNFFSAISSVLKEEFKSFADYCMTLIFQGNGSERNRLFLNYSLFFIKIKRNQR